MPKRDLIVRLDDIDRMILKIEDMQKEISDFDQFQKAIHINWLLKELMK